MPGSASASCAVDQERFALRCVSARIAGANITERIPAADVAPAEATGYRPDVRCVLHDAVVDADGATVCVMFAQRRLVGRGADRFADALSAAPVSGICRSISSSSVCAHATNIPAFHRYPPLVSICVASSAPGFSIKARKGTRGRPPHRRAGGSRSRSRGASGQCRW